MGLNPTANLGIARLQSPSQCQCLRISKQPLIMMGCPIKVSASAVFWAEESFKSKSGSLGLTNKCIQYSKGGDRNLVGSDGRRKSNLGS